MGRKKAKLNIKAALKKQGVSQYELAQRLGLQTQHTTKMVKADYNPTFATLVKVANAIDCKVADLIEE